MANQIAYGFVNLESLFDQQVNTLQTNVVETALATTLAEHNRQTDAIIGLFTTRVTVPSERYAVPGMARLQPLDQNGRARPILTGGYYDVGYPLRGAGTAWGLNWQALETITVREINRIVNTFLIADLRWLRDQILAGLFSNTDWVFADPKYGNITVRTLARGEAGYVYQIVAGAELAATDTHLLAQAGAILTATDPIPTIVSELREHPENGNGDVIILVPTANRSACEGLASFVEPGDAAIRAGANSDTLVTSLGTAVPGEVFGYHRSKAWLVEWKILPDNYLIGVMNSGEKALGIREPEIAALRGFRQVAERNDYPWFEKQWFRSAGIGARNRVGAAVMRVGNGTYAVPGTAPYTYQAPLG